MHRYMLDTDTSSYIMKRSNAQVLKKLQHDRNDGARNSFGAPPVSDRRRSIKQGTGFFRRAYSALG